MILRGVSRASLLLLSTAALSFAAGRPLLAATAAAPAPPVRYVDECPIDAAMLDRGLWIYLDGAAKDRRKALAKIESMMADVDQSLSRSTEGLYVEERADGTKRVKLQGRFQSALVVRENGDGTVSAACVDTAEQARRFTTATATPAPAAQPVEKAKE